jgi:RNA polymerase sigma-70 factor, ECF subfamily
LKAVGNEPQPGEGVLRLDGESERHLIEAAQQDPSRFAELYEQHFDRVYAFVARRVRDRDAAEDVTAEVFHQALACLAAFQWRGAPFAAWLFGIAARVVAHRWQRNGLRHEIASDELPEVGGEDQTERRAILAQLIDALPHDQRQVIIRRVLDGRSVREIAQELARSEGAVKQLQFRALQTLRAKFRSGQ